MNDINIQKIRIILHYIMNYLQLIEIFIALSFLISLAYTICQLLLFSSLFTYVKKKNHNKDLRDDVANENGGLDLV